MSNISNLTSRLQSLSRTLATETDQDERERIQSEIEEVEDEIEELSSVRDKGRDSDWR